MLKKDRSGLSGLAKIGPKAANFNFKKTMMKEVQLIIN
jgi:hypothetical protein